MIVVTIAISSFPSPTSTLTADCGPIRQRWQTRMRVHDSLASLSPIQHLEMKSASLSAERASSSIVANDRLQFRSCGTMRRPTPPLSDNRWQKGDDLARVLERTIADVLAAFEGGMLFHAHAASTVNARLAEEIAGFIGGRTYPYADSAYAFQIPNSKFLILNS